MKLVKQEGPAPELFKFASLNLPDSLIACKWSCGSYSYTYGIKAGNRFWGTRVAEFDEHNHMIKVREVGYLSDITDLAENYERCCGIEVTVQYSEEFVPLEEDCIVA